MKVVKEKIHNAGYVVQYKRESISCFVPCSNLTKQCRIAHQEITAIISHLYDEIILHVYISLTIIVKIKSSIIFFVLKLSEFRILTLHILVQVIIYLL